MTSSHVFKIHIFWPRLSLNCIYTAVSRPFSLALSIMAQVNSSSLGGGSPSASGPLGRIRNSCNACALQKLKCPQQKPTCSRCAKRGTICEYDVAKQGGRKPNNSRGSSDKRKSAVPGTLVTTNDNLHVPSQAGGFG